MRFRLLLALIMLLTGCSNLLYRSGRDYFPLARGSLWKYFDGQDTSHVRVGADSLIGGRDYVVVYVNDSAGFWLKTVPEQEIRRRVHGVFQLGGYDYELADRPALVYLLPLVTGNRWSESHDTTQVIRGDTVKFGYRIEAGVAGYETVTVPAGVFEECYRLEFTETMVVRSSVATDSTTINYSEWLAPGVGPVRRQVGGRELELIEYRIGTGEN